MKSQVYRIEMLACFILSNQTHALISALWLAAGFTCMILSLMTRGKK